MRTKPFLKNRLSPIVHYVTLFWTVFCFVGTWFVILKYGILFKGLIATVLFFFFAVLVWTIPFSALILLSLYVAPPEEARPLLRFTDLMKKALKEGSGDAKQRNTLPREAT